MKDDNTANIMIKPLNQFFSNDHRRIEDLLATAIEDPNSVLMEYYLPFRVGLLTHIKMEEKILFPIAQKFNGGVPHPLALKLRLDHGALTALMVVPPTPEVIKVLNYILERHDILEEEPGGMYDICEDLVEGDTDEILEQLKNYKEVSLSPINAEPSIMEAVKRAVKMADLDFDTIANEVK